MLENKKVLNAIYNVVSKKITQYHSNPIVWYKRFVILDGNNNYGCVFLSEESESDASIQYMINVIVSVGKIDNPQDDETIIDIKNNILNAIDEADNAGKLQLNQTEITTEKVQYGYDDTIDAVNITFICRQYKSFEN